MMKRSSLLVAMLAVAFAMPGVVFAHGGTYTGPSGGGTPGYDGPVGGGTGGPDAGGPTDPGGGGTTPGGGGGGTTGPTGPGPTGPVGPGGGAAGGASGGIGGTTPRGGSRPKGLPQYTNWEWWWDLNEEQFLNLKSYVRGQQAESDDTDRFFGGSEGGSDIAKLTLDEIRRRLIPLLKKATLDEFYDVRAAAVIALGKVGRSEEDVDLIDAIKALHDDTDRRVRESTMLGLGLLGSKDVVGHLLDIFENKPAARKIMGRGTADILTRTRSWAAVAVGLILQRTGVGPEDTESINRLLEGARSFERDRDLSVGPAIALQLIDSKLTHVPMMEIAADTSADEYVRAHVVVALGKQGVTQSRDLLAKLLRDKQMQVARSAAISLGLLCDRETDQKYVMELKAQAERGRDAGVKNFSIISLGRIGHPQGIEYLVRTITRGKNQVDRTFAAIALGIVGNSFEDEKPTIAEPLVRAFKKAKAESEKGAFSIALGLLGEEEGKELVRAELKNRGQQELKGYACTALGLLNHQAAREEIRDLVRQNGIPDLRRRAAIALGLLRDREATTLLAETIKEKNAGKGVLGAATVAMGFIGDKESVEILRPFIQKPDEYQDLSRAFATVGLGFLGDKDPLPMLSFIHENSNYLAQTQALAELLSIL